MKTTQNAASLKTLLARLDEVRMSEAERQQARAALTQADALVDLALDLVRLAKRLVGPRSTPLRPTSAHSQ